MKAGLRTAKGRFTKGGAKKRKGGKRKRKKTVAKATPKRRRRKSTIAKTPKRRKNKKTNMAKRKKGRKSGGRRRRTTRTVGGRGRGIVGGLKGLFSRDMLHITGGAIAASAVNNLLVARFAGNLPMYGNAFGKAAYSVLAPFAMSLVVRKMAPKFADGLIIGGMLSGATQLIQSFAPSSGLSDYVTAQPSYPILPRRLPVASPYVDNSRGNTLALGSGFSGVYDSPTPYSADAWAN